MVYSAWFLICRTLKCFKWISIAPFCWFSRHSSAFWMAWGCAHSWLWHRAFLAGVCANDQAQSGLFRHWPFFEMAMYCLILTHADTYKPTNKHDVALEQWGICEHWRSSTRPYPVRVTENFEKDGKWFSHMHTA